MKQKQLLALLMTGAVTFCSVPVTAAAQSMTTVTTDPASVTDSSAAEESSETEVGVIDTETADSINSSDQEVEPVQEPEENTDGTESDAQSDPAEENTDTLTDSQASENLLDGETEEEPGEEITEEPTVTPEESKTVEVTTAAELQKAIDESAGTAEDPQVIYLKGKKYSNSDNCYMQVDSPIVIQDKYVKIVASENLDIKRKKLSENQDSQSDMFRLISGSLEFDVAEGKRLNVYGIYGNEDPTIYSGSIVNIASGVFTMNSGVTLKRNKSKLPGAGIYNKKDGVVVLNGGSIIQNRVFLTEKDIYRGGGIGSYGKVVLNGAVTVKNNGIVESNFSEVAGNYTTIKVDTTDNICLVYSSGAYVEIRSTLETGSYVGFNVYYDKYDFKNPVIKAASKSVDLAKSIENNGTRQLIYDNPLKYGLDKKGYLTKPPTLQGTGSKGNAVLKWNGTPDSVSTSFIFNSNADGVCRYLVKEYKESRKEIQLRNSDFLSGAARSQNVYAGKTFSISLKDLSPSRKYVLFLQAEDANHGVVNSYVDLSASSAGRPTITPSPTQGPTATPVPDRPVVKVTDCTVTGLEEPLEFYPYYMYRFTVTGAGTGNGSPQEGDVKWCPFTFATNPNYTPNDDKFSAEDEADSKEFEIGNSKGILHAEDYTLYVWFRKYTYTNGSWQRQGYKDRVAVSFQSAELDAEKFYAKLSGTPIPDEELSGNGYDAQDYDGLSDPENGSDPDGADASNHSTSGSETGSTKSGGARTADETPLGTMMMLLSASVLAGGYTLVRKRKKNE